MNEKEIRNYFLNVVKSNAEVSVGIAAIQTLIEIAQLFAGTIQELENHLKNGIKIMKNCNYPLTAINSGCELFLRFITFATLDNSDYATCKNIMLERGVLFLERLKQARGQIVKSASKFIVDNCKVLTHSRSRVVLQTLIAAAKQNKKFQVFVTASAPDNSGEQMCKDLEKHHIPCTLILDAAIGYIMEQIDFIMVGAEGVVESGGIVNKVGSYTMAVCASVMKKPFYVLAESFKFTRLFPLNQQDLPPEYKYTSDVVAKEEYAKTDPLVDYTPPAYITLLFTDLGVLTPSAVSDELIKLYL